MNLTISPLAVILVLDILIGGISLAIKIHKKRDRDREINARIKSEYKAIQNFMKDAMNNEQQNARVVQTYEIAAKDHALCPYCGSEFSANDIKCKSCGASISKSEGKLVISKTTEHQEALNALQYKHIEHIKELELEKERIKQDRKKNTQEMLIVCSLVIVFMIIVACIVINGIK